MFTVHNDMFRLAWAIFRLRL